jgi:hypothetical protein
LWLVVGTLSSFTGSLEKTLTIISKSPKCCSKVLYFTLRHKRNSVARFPIQQFKIDCQYIRHAVYNEPFAAVFV